MDAVVKNFPKTTVPAAPEKAVLSDHVRAAPEPSVPRPSRGEAEAAVRTLLAYMGEIRSVKAWWRRRSGS